jgi:hypothetical protein
MRNAAMLAKAAVAKLSQGLVASQALLRSPAFLPARWLSACSACSIDNEFRPIDQLSRPVRT